MPDRESGSVRLKAAADTLSAAGLKTELNADLKRLTTMRVGGSIALAVWPQSETELELACEILSAYAIPQGIVGNGSNIIGCDGDFFGAAVMTAGLKGLSIDEKGLLNASAGEKLSAFAAFALGKSLSGAEFSAGIPGTVGAAVYMNAGAYGGCMADIVRSVRYYDFSAKKICEFSSAECDFAYRHSVFTKMHGAILSARFELVPEKAELIRAKMEDLNKKRREKQPLELPSSGSTFKRPSGDFAGRLIEQAGLKGKRHGGASVSGLHAGFVVNDGGASAADVRELIREVADEVEKSSGIRLEREALYIEEVVK